MSKVPTLDEWVEENGFSKVRRDLEIHCQAMMENPKDAPALTRLLFISLRQEMETRPIVYGYDEEDCRWWTTEPDEDDTHRARLVCIEKMRR
jgi:hypothetical protein